MRRSPFPLACMIAALSLLGLAPGASAQTGTDGAPPAASAEELAIASEIERDACVADPPEGLRGMPEAFLVPNCACTGRAAAARQLGMPGGEDGDVAQCRKAAFGDIAKAAKPWGHGGWSHSEESEGTWKLGWVSDPSWNEYDTIWFRCDRKLERVDVIVEDEAGVVGKRHTVLMASPGAAISVSAEADEGDWYPQVVDGMSYGRFAPLIAGGEPIVLYVKGGAFLMDTNSRETFAAFSKECGMGG